MNQNVARIIARYVALVSVALSIGFYFGYQKRLELELDDLKIRKCFAKYYAGERFGVMYVEVDKVFCKIRLDSPG